MIDFNLSKSIGFEMCAFIPEAMLAFTSSSKAFAVMAIIGMDFALVLLEALILLALSYPSIIGIWISMKIISNSSGLSSVKTLKASRPSSAITHFIPMLSNSSVMISAFISLSSATRILTPEKSSLLFPSSSVFVPHGVEVNTDTIKYVMNDEFVILCTAEVIAIGDVWSIYYSQPWFDALSINGESFKTSEHYPGHRVTDANGNSVECPDCLPPIFAVYSSKNSSIEDVEIIDTH